jgi:hypothetical protein
MICAAKPVLTEDLCVVQKEEFSIPYYSCMCHIYFDKRPSMFIRDKPILWSERCYIWTITARVQLEKKSLVVSLKGLGAKTN